MTSTIYAKRSFKVGTIGPATTNPVGTVLWDEPASSVSITVSGLSVETVGMKITLDGSTFSGALKPVDVTTGAVTAAATLGNGTYVFTGPCRGIQISKSTTSENATVLFNAVF